MLLLFVLKEGNDPLHGTSVSGEYHLSDLLHGTVAVNARDLAVSHIPEIAVKELLLSYARAYYIAKLNKKRLQMKASLKELLAAYRAYLQEKELIIRVVG